MTSQGLCPTFPAQSRGTPGGAPKTKVKRELVGKPSLTPTIQRSSAHTTGNWQEAVGCSPAVLCLVAAQILEGTHPTPTPRRKHRLFFFWP